LHISNKDQENSKAWSSEEQGTRKKMKEVLDSSDIPNKSSKDKHLKTLN